MNILRLARYAVGVSAAAAMLAACNGMQSSTSAVPGAPQQNAATSHGAHGLPSLQVQKLMNVRGLGIQMPRHSGKYGKSWMSPLAKHTQYLLYVSDINTGQVDVLNYKSQAGNLYGQLTGFSLAGPSCTDSSGNVFIVDLGVSTITEFAHGSSTATAGPVPITLSSLPLGCAADSSGSGNVALPSFGSGNVDIFVGGITGTETAVATPYAYAEGTAYDPSGNLYIENSATTSARSNGNVIYLEECPATCAGGSSFHTVSLPNQSCGSPVCFMSQPSWDGNYLSLGDQAYSYPTLSYDQGAYRVSISGSTGTVVSSAGFLSPSSAQTDGQNWWANGTRRTQKAATFADIANGDYVGNWNLNSGGTPNRTVPTSLSVGFYGASVSALHN